MRLTTQGGGHFKAEIAASTTLSIPHITPPGQGDSRTLCLIFFCPLSLDAAATFIYNITMNELLQRHDATLNGLFPGSRLTVPEGCAGVVVFGNRTYDVLPPGEYSLDAATLPLLLQKVRPKASADPSLPLPATVFLVAMTLPVNLSWEGLALLSKSAAYGLTYTRLAGRVGVQVQDPARFCTALLAASGKAGLPPDAPLGQVAAYFLRANVQEQALKAVAAMNLPPEQAPHAREAIRTAAGQAAARWLSGAGIYCGAFDLDTVTEPDRAPCAGCGSAQVPTGYGDFRRNISLLYLRFTAKKEGNFCVPCALKVSAAYNGVMLVCGWWGIIGLVLTPVYFCQNVYYFARIALGEKQTPRAGQAVALPEGSTWPPAPTV